MKIKTYAVNCFDAWLNTEGDDISDSYVKYKDHKEVVAALQSALDVQSARSDALAAENLALKDAMKNGVVEKHQQTSHGITIGVKNVIVQREIDTPATDTWVNGQRTIGRAEGVNFAASRLAAAFNHGFINKPTAEVYDVVKAVLGAKEELATAPDDGLSGEYAEQALNDWAAQFRGGQV